MTELKFRNEFISRAYDAGKKTGGFTEYEDSCGAYSDQFIKGNLFNGTGAYGGGPCYGELDSRPWFGEAKVDEFFVYLPPNRVGCMAPKNNPTKESVLEERRFFSLWNFFHPDSPWSPVVDAMGETFEGYDTPEEKADLVARYGWFFHPNVFKEFSKINLGAFMVATRRQNCYPGIRKSFKAFMEDKRTRDLPLAWNMFAAHHIDAAENGKLLTLHLDNGHSPFFPGYKGETGASFVTHKLPGCKEKNSWAATKGAGSWQGHNSDHIFPHLWKGKSIPTWEYMASEIEKSKNDVVAVNLLYYNTYVKDFI